MIDDLFSSSKGPGMIGLLLGLFVLAGFCGLGFAVFDGRLNGDFVNKEQREFSHNQQKIANLETRLKTYEATAEKRKTLKKVASQLAQASTQLELRGQRKGELEAEVDAAQAEVANAADTWEAYKEEYRAFARERIKGRVVEELVTEDGDVYRNARVTEASPLELGIMTPEGPKRVKLDVLPKALRDELQYDQDQAAALAERIVQVEGERGEMARIHVRTVQLRNLIHALEAKIQKHDETINTAATRKDANEAAARQLDRDAVKFMQAFQADQAAGRGGTSRNDNRADSARRNATSLRNKNVQIDREVGNARAEKRTFQDEIEMHKKEIEALEAERRAIIEDRGKASAPEAG